MCIMVKNILGDLQATATEIETGRDRKAVIAHLLGNLAFFLLVLVGVLGLF